MYRISLFLIILSLSRLSADCGIPFCNACSYHDDGTCHLFYGGEGLWWTVYQSNLGYAVDVDADDPDLIVGEGKTHFLDYEWKGGARGWMGWNWDHGWDLRAVYTWFRCRAVNEMESDDDDDVFFAAFFHPASDFTLANEAEGKMKIEYQTADVLFGKIISFCCNKLVIHPYFGARAMRLQQFLKVEYEGEDFIDETGVVRWDSDVKALGLVSGMDTHLIWDCGFEIYGAFSGSLLASRTENEHKQLIVDEEGDVTAKEIDLEERQHVTVPGYHLSAGIGWSCRREDCYFLKFRFGYEFNRWFCTQQLRRYDETNQGVSCGNTSGSICLHGAVLTAEVFF